MSGGFYLNQFTFYPSRVGYLPLRDDPTGDAPPTPAVLLGRIGVVVAPRVDHERAALEVGEPEAWRHRFAERFSRGIDGQEGKITKVALTRGTLVAAGPLRIVVGPGGECGLHRPIFLGRLTARVLMHVQAMGTRREALQARLDDEPRRDVGEHDRTDGRSEPAGIDPVDLNAQALGRGGGACRKCHDDKHEG